MNQGSLSEELIERGWSQGCLFSARSAMHPSLTYSPADDGQDVWSVEHEALADDDLLVVITQTCDINNDREPHVEVVCAYWTTDRGEINSAETNSSRLFLLKRRAAGRGEEGLLADLTRRISVKKAALLPFQAEKTFPSENDDRLRLFQRRLALRYQRPAIPTALVEAVQQPIANAAGKLSTSHEIRRILRKIHEILILPVDFEQTNRVDLAFMVSEQTTDERLSVEESARLAAWIETALQKRGRATINVAEQYTYEEISARTLIESYRMPLSHISTEDEPAAPEL
jgi:hypothetical protein